MNPNSVIIFLQFYLFNHNNFAVFSLCIFLLWSQCKINFFVFLVSPDPYCMLSEEKLNYNLVIDSPTTNISLIFACHRPLS